MIVYVNMCLCHVNKKHMIRDGVDFTWPIRTYSCL